MKRLAVIAIVVVAVMASLAGPASAQQGAPGFEIKESQARVKADGPGFPIQESETNLGAIPTLRPFVCENGTYRIVSGTFRVTQRGSSTEPRPLPYTPAFALAFPRIITFVGTGSPAWSS